MDLATITSKGQITIPADIRKKLKLKTGDKVFFVEEKGKIYFENASQVALGKLQEAIAGEAIESGFKDEEAVVRYIKDLRQGE